MRARSAAACVLVVSAAFIGIPAFAHHSNLAFLVTEVVTVSGVVKSFEWRNPHPWLVLMVDNGKGGKADWALEGRAPGVLLRAGGTKESLKPGEMATVDMSPAKGWLEDRIDRARYQG